MQIPDELIEACKNNKCVPFVGAGMSAQSGLPSWSDIINEMSSFLINRSLRKVDEENWLKQNGALLVAERFKETITRSQYQIHLNKWFDPPEVNLSNAHTSLFKIKWPFLITTNFDRLLELAYSNARQKMARTPITFEELVRAEASNEPYILKLHGSVEDPESIVLTETDYARMDSDKNDMLKHIEKSIMVFKKVLFLGFSMKDPEIRSAFLKSRIHSKGYALGDFTVLTKPNAVEKEIWEKRGLTVIALNDHSELSEFLNILDTLINSDQPINASNTKAINSISSTSIETNNIDTTYLPPLPDPFVELSISLSSMQEASEEGSYYVLPNDYESLLSANSIITITGEAGSGKTTILNGAVQYLNKNNRPFIFVKAAHLEAKHVSLKKHISELTHSDKINIPVLIDGLDECNPELASSILSILHDFFENNPKFTGIVTTRPIDAPELKNMPRYSVLPLSEPEFFKLAIGDIHSTKRLQSILSLSPSLHGRPLHAKTIGAYIEDNNKEPETEADYALWLLDNYYETENINEEIRNSLEVVASELYIKTKAVVWSLADWATTAQDVFPIEDQIKSVIDSIIELTGEDKLFIGSGGKLVPRHRTAYEAMVGRGLSRTGGLNRLLTNTTTVDETSIMLACLLKTLPIEAAKKSMAIVVRRAPWLAARVMLGAGEESEIKDLLLNKDFELDLTSAIRHGVAILGATSYIDFVKPLFSRSIRNPSLLWAAVDSLESLVETLTDEKDIVRARSLLNRLWDEHKESTETIVWIDIPGGYYKCGTNEGQDIDEEPEHEVFLNPFRLSKFQITNVQYEQFDPLYIRDRLSLEDDMPAVNITWHEAQLFCRWVTGNSGGRLPTEAEWESACRAGTSTRYYWGEQFDSKMANCGENNRGMTTVGSYPPNRFDVYDMAGNVYEWCFDWYHDKYYSNYSKINPTGPTTGRMKSMRGGSWGRSANASSCSYRVRQVPETRDVLVGFRACWPYHT